MPHSTTETMTNGNSSPTSKTLSHLSSYPTVATGIDKVKSHPYGKKSLELVDQAYARFGKPVEPYLETPYQYAKPYVSKADELGDKALGSVEGRFPIVKEKPETIWETGKGWAFWPYNYALDAWNDEYGKTAKKSDSNGGLIVLITALVSFQLRVASDAFNTVVAWSKPKYEESKKKSAEYARLAQETAEDARKHLEGKAGEAKKLGEQYINLAQENGEQYAKTAQRKAEDVKEDAKETKEQAEKNK